MTVRGRILLWILATLLVAVGAACWWWPAGLIVCGVSLWLELWTTGNA